MGHLLLSADVLVLLGEAGHLPDADPVLDVFELQAQVLPGDGQHGAPLPGARLREQLWGGRANQSGHALSRSPISIRGAKLSVTRNDS